MRKYEVTITGSTPLLMHWDNIEWSDKMEAWGDDPANRADSKAGDDRSPAWRWIGSAYHDDQHLTIPSDNIMRALMEGGTMVPVPGGRGGKTFKAQTQSGMMVNEAAWPVDVGGRLVPVAEIFALMKEKDFAVHRAKAQELGFSLFIKRARIQTSKHIRVRPRFDTWRAHGTVSVWDKKITDSVLRDFFSYAGQYKGLGDWRPGSKTPGSFGMFTAELRELGAA